GPRRFGPVEPAVSPLGPGPSYYHRSPRTEARRARARGQKRAGLLTFAGEAGDGLRRIEPTQQSDRLSLGVPQAPQVVPSGCSPDCDVSTEGPPLPYHSA